MKTCVVTANYSCDPNKVWLYLTKPTLNHWRSDVSEYEESDDGLKGVEHNTDGGTTEIVFTRKDKARHLSCNFRKGKINGTFTAILMGGVSAFALTPALPDEPAPAELSVTNAVSEAQLRSALSKLTVTYDSEAEGWQIDSPYEEASMEKASCGLYPYLFVTNDDPTVYLSLGMTYFGNKKLDMKSVRVETEDNYYDFTCDDQFTGGYDNDLKSWFDYELFDMDDSTSWLNEWLAAKSVTATFTGKDGSTKTYTLTRDNLQAIRDILNAYDTLLGSDVSTARVVLRSLVK